LPCSCAAVKTNFQTIQYEVSKPVSIIPAASHPSFRLGGKLRLPGDKSISHRALILGALAQGQTTIEGLLESEDVLHTLSAMRALGAECVRDDTTSVWQINGVGEGGWSTPDVPLDFGNSGTGVRLVMGMVAGLGMEASFIGDESLSGRPMNRVLNPLQKLGVQATSQNGCLPVRLLAGTPVPAMQTQTPIASAQVKSALLLASLRANGTSEIIEPSISRDHTERMLRAFGAILSSEILPDRRHKVCLSGPAKLTGTSIGVPGDPSSAAFPITAALCIEGSDIVLENVLMNPTRSGFIQVAKRMGGRIDVLNPRTSGGEQVADLRVRGSHLHGVTTAPDIVPSMVDEFPALTVLAAFADGVTEMRGLGELRVKESDRIARCVDLLQSVGVGIQSGEDWMRVDGTGAVFGAAVPGAPVRTDGDHRIAMAALVLGMASFKSIHVDDPGCIKTSWPSFFDDMRALGARFQTVGEGRA
jgi:3-phosphoshikimate 1-carboxyvinyltransferase